MNYIKKFNNFLVSEKLNYHLDNNISVIENVFRPGSDSFLELIKEARLLFDSGDVIFSGLDRYLFESTDLGKFVEFDGVMVPLDLPMETVEEMNEASAKYAAKSISTKSKRNVSEDTEVSEENTVQLLSDSNNEVENETSSDSILPQDSE